MESSTAQPFESFETFGVTTSRQIPEEHHDMETGKMVTRSPVHTMMKSRKPGDVSNCISRLATSLFRILEGMPNAQLSAEKLFYGLYLELKFSRAMLLTGRTRLAVSTLARDITLATSSALQQTNVQSNRNVYCVCPVDRTFVGARIRRDSHW